MRWLGIIALASAVVATTTLVGCGSSDDGDGSGTTTKKPKPGTTTPPVDGTYDTLPAETLKERPWEVLSKKGESYLTNVFYADPSENEQIMPWQLEGHTQIDRLIYPTLGNPNLYVKADASDELVMVLRIEPDAYDHLRPIVAPFGEDSPLSAVTLTEDGDNEFAFFLVARNARSTTEASTTQVSGPSGGVYRIKPTVILQNPEPADEPAAFKQRHTLRFVFDKNAMAQVPAGLYDTRFEVRKAGEIFANVYEYQYNAVRVFDAASDEYTALNVTDTQVSVGAAYQDFTAAKLDDFVTGVNSESDPAVANAAFITFNGDLHNGGSPGTIRINSVATTYASEAKRIVDTLKNLNLPIFLTVGNHDGYAATGQAPDLVVSAEDKVGESLQKVVGEQNNVAWPDFSWDAYNAYLGATKLTPGGLHKDLFFGNYQRAVGDTFGTSFKEVARSERNYILYDGFYQWQKSYGPLTASWTFGKNRYVSMNSYELRQHRRTGWGMYTVNYGGNVSQPQLEWLDRELTRGKNAGEDMIVLMHHDPRGGHKGKDFGYYAPPIEFAGMAQSTVNYILSEYLTPAVCKQPDLSLSVDDRDSCLHDGLQEWMAPDEDFDKDGAGYFFSGVELLKRFVKSAHARTLVLGHVHFNSLEMLQSGDVLVPDKVALDPASQQAGAAIEAANPVRRMAWEDKLMPTKPGAWRAFYDAAESAPALDTPINRHTFDQFRADLNERLHAATPHAMTTLSAPMGGPRELAILRFTSGADLSSQKYDGASMYGYSVLHVTKQTDAPRVNRVTYFINISDKFQKVSTIDVDRTISLTNVAPTNPVDKMFVTDR